VQLFHNLNFSGAPSGSPGFHLDFYREACVLEAEEFRNRKRDENRKYKKA
jgi:hypothetical protein